MRVKIDEHLMYLCIWDFSQKEAHSEVVGGRGGRKKDGSMFFYIMC